MDTIRDHLLAVDLETVSRAKSLLNIALLWIILYDQQILIF